MEKTMKKLITLVLFGSLLIATATIAETTTKDLTSDAGAIVKDNNAIAKDNATIAHDRADVAVDKANGNTGKQIKDRIRLGAAQGAKGEKQVEKNADGKIFNHDAGEISKD
jgi:cytochrome c-type biogenesis protein CcmH/NrfF